MSRNWASTARCVNKQYFIFYCQWNFKCFVGRSKNHGIIRIGHPYIYPCDWVRAGLPFSVFWARPWISFCIQALSSLHFYKEKILGSVYGYITMIPPKRTNSVRFAQRSEECLSFYFVNKTKANRPEPPVLEWKVENWKSFRYHVYINYVSNFRTLGRVRNTVSSMSVFSGTLDPIWIFVWPQIMPWRYQYLSL